MNFVTSSFFGRGVELDLMIVPPIVNCSGVRFKILMAVPAGIRGSFRWKPIFGKAAFKKVKEGGGDGHKSVLSVVRADDHEAGREGKDDDPQMAATPLPFSVERMQCS